MAHNFSPKFLKADLSFELKDHQFKAGQQYINSSGAISFIWYQFNPLQYLGQKVAVHLKLIDVPNEEFACIGVLSHEQVGSKVLLRISFQLDIKDQIRLEQLLSEAGTLPDFTRKFPRIAFTNKIAFMPSRAFVELLGSEQKNLVFCSDIENISPKGVQVSTDDPRVLKVPTETPVTIELQPRGNHNLAIPLEGKLKRIIRIVEPQTGNLRAYLGFDALPTHEDDKEAFSQLLKDIVKVVNELE